MAAWNLGPRLVGHMQREGLSISEVARRSGLPRSSVWQLRSFEYSPEPATVEKLMGALGITLEQLREAKPAKGIVFDTRLCGNPGVEHWPADAIRRIVLREFRRDGERPTATRLAEIATKELRTEVRYHQIVYSVRSLKRRGLLDSDGKPTKEALKAS